MTNQSRSDQLSMASVLGISSAVFTGTLFGLIEVWTGFAVYSVTIWFIVPLGATFVGIVAASGYYFGARWFNQKPDDRISRDMLLAALGTYFLVHYVPYFLTEVDGVRVKDAISFWQYLDYGIRHTSIPIEGGEESSAELGVFWGYLYALFQLLCFCVGGSMVFDWLKSVPYCEKCSKYLKKTNTQERYTSDAEKLSEQIQTFAELLNEKQYLKALQFHTDEMGVTEAAKHHLNTRIVMHKCPSCGINHLQLNAHRRVDSSWKEIPKTEIKVWANHQSDTSAEPSTSL